ncbi:hypothetical protein V8B97DRAFT_1915400 [Scleroderma yunnanense]
MTWVAGGFFFSPEDACAWARRGAPNEIFIRGTQQLSANIYTYFWRKGMPLRAVTVFDREGNCKILITTDSIEVPREEAMNYPAFKFGKNGRRAWKELFEPYKDEFSFLNPGPIVIWPLMGDMSTSGIGSKSHVG